MAVYLHFVYGFFWTARAKIVVTEISQPGLFALAPFRKCLPAPALSRENCKPPKVCQDPGQRCPGDCPVRRWVMCPGKGPVQSLLLVTLRKSFPSLILHLIGQIGGRGDAMLSTSSEPLCLSSSWSLTCQRCCDPTGELCGLQEAL